MADAAGVVAIGATVVVGLFLSGVFDDPEAAQIVSGADNSLTSQGASSQADDLRSRIKPSSLPSDFTNSMGIALAQQWRTRDF